MLYLLIPIVCAFLFFGALMARQERKALQIQGANSVEAMHSQLDQTINSVMQMQLRMANDSNMMVALKKILQSGNKISYGDAIYVRCINTILRSIVDSHGYLSSVYLYFDGYDSYFSSELKSAPLTEADERWLSVYREMPEDAEGISRLGLISSISDGGNSGDTENVQVLSVYRRTLIQDGVVVMNLNLKRLQENLDNMSRNAFEGLYLFDASGNLLIADSKRQVGEENLKQMKELLLENPDRIKNGSRLRIGNGYYLVQTDYYSLYQIYLVSLIPESVWFSQLMPLFGMFVLFFLVDLVIAILLSYFTTRRNFRQIEYTLDLFNKAEQGIFPEQETGSPKDEYGVIMNNILHMFLKTSYLNTQLAERQYRQQVMELSTLQYQINPHFLFNTLQTVELETRKITGDTTTINQILHDLSDLLKYALANPQQLVTLREELRYLKEYAQIQQYRLGEKFLIYYEIDEEWMDAQMLRLLLQPLLENSILHGIRESSRKGYIKIRVHSRNGWMLFSVIDNGIGMTKEKIAQLRKRLEDENSKNIGLTNVNRRLLLRYGEESQLKILAKKGWGTCMKFKIPLEKTISKR